MEARAAIPPLGIRLADVALIALIFIASLALVATPIGWLWLLSNLSVDPTEFHVLALLGCPSVIIGWGLLVLRLNGLHQRLARTDSRVVLEASVSLGVMIALAAMTFWFFAGSGGTHLGP
jgi:hypothetical protein